MAPPRPVDPVTAVRGADDILALFEEDLAAGIRAGADLREQRAGIIPRGALTLYRGDVWLGDVAEQLRMFDMFGDDHWWPYKAGEPSHPFGGDPVSPEVAEHIAAEANPTHALAAVHRWRGVVKRHGGQERFGPRSERECGTCIGSFAYEEGADWPCPDLTDTADEVRAYLGNPTPPSQREEPQRP